MISLSDCLAMCFITAKRSPAFHIELLLGKLVIFMCFNTKGGKLTINVFSYINFW